MITSSSSALKTSPACVGTWCRHAVQLKSVHWAIETDLGNTCEFMSPIQRADKAIKKCCLSRQEALREDRNEKRRLRDQIQNSTPSRHSREKP
jgi:hypothetical protein